MLAGTAKPVGPDSVKLAFRFGATANTDVKVLSGNLLFEFAAAQNTVTVSLLCWCGSDVCPNMVTGPGRVTLSYSV